jgi:hypothetical protein
MKSNISRRMIIWIMNEIHSNNINKIQTSFWFEKPHFPRNLRLWILTIASFRDWFESNRLNDFKVENISRWNFCFSIFSEGNLHILDSENIFIEFWYDDNISSTQEKWNLWKISVSITFLRWNSRLPFSANVKVSFLHLQIWMINCLWKWNYLRQTSFRAIIANTFALAFPRVQHLWFFFAKWKILIHSDKAVGEMISRSKFESAHSCQMILFSWRKIWSRCPSHIVPNLRLTESRQESCGSEWYLRMKNFLLSIWQSSIVMITNLFSINHLSIWIWSTIANWIRYFREDIIHRWQRFERERNNNLNGYVQFSDKMNKVISKSAAIKICHFMN